MLCIRPELSLRLIKTIFNSEQYECVPSIISVQTRSFESSVDHIESLCLAMLQ